MKPEKSQTKAKERGAEMRPNRFVSSPIQDGGTPEQKCGQPLLPLRMLAQHVYCPRLFYLMHVEQQMVANAHVWRGRTRHKKVDRHTDRALGRKVKEEEGREGPPDSWRSVTALQVSSERLGITGKLDSVLLDLDKRVAIPVELKSGRRPDPARHRPPDAEQDVWAADAVQVCTQCLLLEERGYEVPHAEIYYATSRTLHRVALSNELRELTGRCIHTARETEQLPLPPPPLEDSPKCPGCSLLSVCMPGETALLRSKDRETPQDDEPRRSLRRVIPARVEDTPVMVTTAGASIRKDGTSLRIDLPEKVAMELGVPRTKHVALERLHELCIASRVQMSTQALVSCLERGIPVAVLGAWGRLAGVALPVLGNNVQLRIAQHKRSADLNESLEIARKMVTGKIQNQRTLIRRNSEGEVTHLLNELASLRRSAHTATDHASLMGMEGRAARVYFGALSDMLAARGGDEFCMEGRTRRPPKDRTNALLSFGYSVLTKDLVGIVHRVGFDPFVGFLHQPGFGRPSLALDLLEEFRALVVDSTVLRVVGQGMVKPGQFRVEAGAVFMLPPARRAFLQALDKRKEELVTHPVFGYRISYLRVMEVQARLLARVIQGEAPEYRAMTTR